MAKDWIERPNETFAQQARIFCDVLATEWAAYHISAADAADLSADYADFAAAQVAAGRPTDRTPVTVQIRDGARRKLQDRMRDVAARIRADRTIDAVARLRLTMTVPPADAGRRTLPPPDEAPTVRVTRVVANVIEVRVTPRPSGRQGKPRDVAGAELFFAAAEQRPSGYENFQRGGVTLSSKGRILIPPSLTSKIPRGTRIWLAARYFNARGPGPLSASVYTHLTEVGLPPAASAAAAA